MRAAVREVVVQDMAGHEPLAPGVLFLHGLQFSGGRRS
jgi:hypothetical protein